MSNLIKYLANKFHWKLSTVKFSQVLSGAALAVAASITCFALRIFGPVGLAVSLGISLPMSLAPLAFGLYARFGGKDLLFEEASKKEEPFYKFAIAL